MRKIIGKTKTEKSIRNVYVLSFILLLLSYFITLYSNRQLVIQADRVQHTNYVIKNLDNILSSVKDAETGVRGFVITKKIEFLMPYYGTQQRVDSLHKVVAELIGDSDVQSTRLRSLKENIDTRFRNLAFSLKSFNENNRERTDTMRSMQPLSIRIMDSIRNGVSLMQREEERLLANRTAGMQQTFRTIDVITFISLVLAFSLIIFGLFTYMQVSKSRKNAQQDVEDYQERLNKRIEELDEANEELIKMRSQEKFAATGRIARTIAHEVRNPLTNINLAADQLKDELSEKENEQMAFLFDMINRNSSRINQLISDLLNSTKFSELNYEEVSLHDFLEDTLKGAQDRMTLNNIQLTRNYRSDNCVLLVDRIRMKIAVLNLIINAIEAMEGNTERKLDIATQTIDGKCEIIITDNGPGMDEESVLRLFEPYFTTKPKGNGLGLTNTQNIILNHNGEISVRSEPGKGTSFTIALQRKQ